MSARDLGLLLPTSVLADVEVEVDAEGAGRGAETVLGLRAAMIAFRRASFAISNVVGTFTFTLLTVSFPVY